MGIQDKKTQYQLQNKDKNIMLQNRVMSPPIISTVLPPSSASAPTSSSPPPLAACTPMAKKWSCQSCTYENWPKSKNCIICGTRIGKLTFIPESNRESPPPEAASLSQHGNAARNVRPVEPSNLRDQISQISPTLSARSVQTPRYFTQAEIVTNSISTSSVGGSNQVNNYWRGLKVIS